MVKTYSWNYLTPPCMTGTLHFLSTSPNDATKYVCQLHADETFLKSDVPSHVLVFDADPVDATGQPVLDKTGTAIKNIDNYTCQNCGLKVSKPSPITEIV
ncbi:MAG: hypothetical protein ACYDAJ_02660 [Nitrosotalea sp.]